MTALDARLVDGHDWPAIGKAIGWCPETARKHWGWLCSQTEEAAPSSPQPCAKPSTEPTEP